MFTNVVTGILYAKGIMDRSWMYKSRLDPMYLNGVQEFHNLAFTRASVNQKITCPCVKCGNGIWVSR